MNIIIVGREEEKSFAGKEQAEEEAKKKARNLLKSAKKELNIKRKILLTL